MNLKSTFPVPLRTVVRQNITWVITFSLLVCFHLAHRQALDAFGATSDVPPSYWLYSNESKVLALLGLVLVGRLAVAVMIRSAQDYALEGGRLRVTSGIFRRREALLPLSPSVEFYIQGTFWDLVFGLSNITVSLPGHQDSDAATIRGLSLKSAYGLKQRLAEEIDRLQAERLHRSLQRQNQKPLRRPRVKRELRRTVVAKARREPIAH